MVGNSLNGCTVLHVNFDYCAAGHSPSLPKDRWLFDQESLQEYLLICCQDPRGGLVDKPGKARDFYHTCYTLSGLSVAQNFRWSGSVNRRILGPEETNSLVEVHPLHNVSVVRAARASEYYGRLPIPAWEQEKN